MKEMPGEFVPKQDMINEILKDLELSKETIKCIDKEDVAEHLSIDLMQANNQLVDHLLKETGAFEKEDGVEFALHRNNTQATVPDTSKSVDARAIIDVSPDQMSARIRIAPPEMGGQTITEDAILEALREKRIIKGIKFEYVYRLAQHTVYNRAFKIAQGVMPADGEDAKLLFHFEEVEEPTVFYGPEDYARVQYATVKSGEILCEIEEATPARNGWTIMGKSLPGKEGKSVNDAAGCNTMWVNNALYTTCDGLVSIKDGKVNVHKALTKQELDNKKVKFDGTILVEGNVINSSVIEAAGDIIVKGSVQNSKLFSDGNIIVCKGITGSNSTVCTTGNLRSYFIENAQIKTGGSITTDVVMRADIICGGTLRLSGKRENLFGGTIRIAEDLYAKNLGNAAMIPTEILLIGNEQIVKDKENALQRIKQCRKAIDKLMQALKKAIGGDQTTADRKKLIIEITFAKKRIEKEIEEQNELLEKLCLKEGMPTSGKVVFCGTMYPNVNLNIDGVVHKIEKERIHCTITKHQSELLFSAMRGEKR